MKDGEVETALCFLVDAEMLLLQATCTIDRSVDTKGYFAKKAFCV